MCMVCPNCKEWLQIEIRTDSDTKNVNFEILDKISLNLKEGIF